MIQRSFEKALKKGEIGEIIIQKYLEDKGWIVYCPSTKNRPHYFDMLATKDKEKVVAIDVKTKARLNKWNAQGINTRHHQQYLSFVSKTKVPFFLFFVDDKTGDVHCANISEMQKRKSINPCKGIIAWFLKDMKWMFRISADNINKLTVYDQRAYEFKPTPEANNEQ